MEEDGNEKRGKEWKRKDIFSKEKKAYIKIEIFSSIKNKDKRWKLK